MISAAGKVVVLIFNITKPVDNFDLLILFLHWTLNPFLTLDSRREVNFWLTIQVNMIRFFRKDE